MKTRMRMKRRRKKGQTEIIGLVVIVMILLVALLFVLFFSTRGKSDVFAKSFDEEVHSYNTISTVVQANTPCRSLTIGELLQECAAFDRLVPGECGLSSHCEYAEGEIHKILFKSLDYIQQEYKFYAYRSGDDPSNLLIDIVSDNAEQLCPTSDIVSATQPIRYAGGDLFIVLDICG